MKDLTPVCATFSRCFALTAFWMSGPTVDSLQWNYDASGSMVE